MTKTTTTTSQLTTMVNTIQLKNYLISQENMMHAAEIGWASDIIRNLDFTKPETDSLTFFKFLRNKNLKNHSKVAKFAMKVYNDNGAIYSEIKKEKITMIVLQNHQNKKFLQSQLCNDIEP